MSDASHMPPASSDALPATLPDADLCAALDDERCGLALFDAGLRLLHATPAVGRFLPELAGRLLPGAALEDLLRHVLRVRELPIPAPLRERWIARRLAPPATARRRFTVRTAAGGWVAVQERRCADGRHLLLVRDITDRRRAGEAAAAARAEARRAERAKGEFLAQMSHELRTPLNAIVGFAELMGAEAFGPLGNPRYLSYARDIAESGAHLVTLLDRLFDLARLEGAEMPFVEQSVALDEVMAAVMTAFAEDARAAGIDLVADTGSDLPLLLGDPDGVRHMLSHLVSNAVKFTPPAGQVVVSGNRLPDGGVALMVADTGPGIPPDELAQVLEPFAITHGSLARPPLKGLGLGLPLTRRMVELHGGRLTLDSERGIGTTAILLFPPERSIPREATPPVPWRAAR